MDNSEKKQLQCEADVKKLRELHDAQAFIEGVGVGSVASASGDVKVENPAYTRVVANKESLKYQ